MQTFDWKKQGWFPGNSFLFFIFLFAEATWFFGEEMQMQAARPVDLSGWMEEVRGLREKKELACTSFVYLGCTRRTDNERAVSGIVHLVQILRSYFYACPKNFWASEFRNIGNAKLSETRLCLLTPSRTAMYRISGALDSLRTVKFTHNSRATERSKEKRQVCPTSPSSLQENLSGGGRNEKKKKKSALEKIPGNVCTVQYEKGDCSLDAGALSERIILVRTGRARFFEIFTSEQSHCRKLNNVYTIHYWQRDSK